ncbi:MAG: hypothetical protein UR28_C0039G0023 [Candidatus Peregrinibacteria bacterium GW2011_GWF2_33_10]|nr:MAG: hypothetical protein UR28_C0039G0023 [Candidatus Peregrinibacteria bacterium GW2011_GWF2_33_10]OGJ44515.1 MAG: hypothetical protein A2263_05700 [Candidatus Peregrinibacteria bacterium RIFOXYA2_FULL_33_21]OGJ46751.1 MAG: hypothetical protein A2272_03635 [Candidatus Peregrinibacteria bacterium RIFOXYA12_FULL_33_12]OGJ50323.1 MAG: hypothetical protein A2307_06280 [Candidatus Peregrinibacteria bacterium RIFOXYB2_FULL_33_20]
MIRTANPALNDHNFRKPQTIEYGTEMMTIQGAVNKTAILVILAFASATFVWQKFFTSGGDPAIFSGYLTLSAVAAFIISLIIIFKQTSAPILAPIYAILEGVVLGAISSLFEMKYPGIVIQAIALTFGTLFCLLLAYKSRLIKATENFKLGIFAATGGIALVYLISMILGFFGVHIPFIYDGGIGGIIFSLIVVVIAALNLVLDFDFIENAADRGMPKYMEWYSAFGLMVTLVWLYIEILRLLGKMRERR